MTVRLPFEQEQQQEDEELLSKQQRCDDACASLSAAEGGNGTSYDDVHDEAYEETESVLCRTDDGPSSQGRCLFGSGAKARHSRLRRLRRRQMIARCIITPFLMFLSVAIGAFTQKIKTGRIPDTVSLYQTGHVCGIEYPPRLLQELEGDAEDGNGRAVSPAPSTESVVAQLDGTDEQTEAISMVTFDTASDAQQQPNTTVAHCGDCGSCSNPHDIKIYDDTRNTLFQDSLACSKHAVFGGADDVRQCLEERVGFTEGCNECWVENIMCDVRNCLFVCAWQAMFSSVDSDNKDERKPQELNACTQCDEKRCGPAFVKCAGANRRRAGIVSEFKRDDHDEVCHQVETGWWQNDIIQQYYRRQEGL